MPAPAGTGLDRRTFLARSIGAALSVYGATRLPLALFEPGIAAAAAGPAERIFVSVFLPGGADPLSVLYPAGDPLYPKFRPQLGLAAADGTQLTDDPRLYWHPKLEPLATLHAEGKVTVIPAMGYTHPDQSHFTSRHYWEVGATNPSLQTGWLGRYLDRIGVDDNPLQGLSLDGVLQPALASARVPVATIEGPDQYTFWGPGVWGSVEQRMLETFARFGGQHDAAAEESAQIAAQSGRLRQQLLPFVAKDGKDGSAPAITSPVAYPKDESGFPQKLAGLAAMLARGLPLRCVAISAPGEYDTHSDQAASLSSALGVAAQSLLAFQRDLESRGLSDRVLVHVWSEFGRRGQENASGGTDHGAAGVGFLIGTKVGGTMIGEYPGLAHGLDADGNLKATSDFRGLYAAILEQWLGADPGDVIPGAHGFRRPKVVKSA